MTEVFVPVQIAPDMPPTSGGALLKKSVPVGKPYRMSKVSAFLPNGISLTVEYDDEKAGGHHRSVG